MAEIKDKVVTVESLSALHEHNKEAYLTKTNPTGTGSLSLNRKEGTTTGGNSVAVGSNTEASSLYSFAEGFGTIAASRCQHSQGRYNLKDNSNKYAHIVGNGTSDTPSNAYTLDWDGNGCFAGDVYVGGASQDNATKLVKSTNVMSIEYGDTLPAAGTVGRVFFKKLSE